MPFSTGPWTFECADVPEIASERVKDGSGIARFPTMPFHRSGLVVSLRGQVCLQLDCMTLLRSVQHDRVPPHLQTLVDLNQSCFPVVPYDWTFEPHVQFQPDSAVVIDYGRLADRAAPILWFAEACLWEDELFDCGRAKVVVKVRVMPYGWFALLTHTVDYAHDGQQLHRERQYRFFCSFLDDRIVCEARTLLDGDELVERGFIRILK